MPLILQEQKIKQPAFLALNHYANNGVPQEDAACGLIP